MKRRYKILLIILMGILFTIIINLNLKENKVNLVSLGDGFALGMTSYGIEGTSYNDYLKDYLDKKYRLGNYNNEFSIEQLDIEKLNDILEDNELGSKSKVPIKQIIAKADIITIGLGMDEIMDYQIKNKLNEERIIKFINNYQKFIKEIRLFYDKDIVVIGLYSAFNIDKNIIYDINKKLQQIALENKCKFLDISAIALKEDNFLDKTSYYMNYKGHKEIYNSIMKIIKV